jgi:hypothetical protein
LPDGGTTRRERAARAVKGLENHFEHARLEVLSFGQEGVRPYSERANTEELSVDSDLVRALDAVARSAGERPRAVIVVSDGRLAQPADGMDDEVEPVGRGTLRLGAGHFLVGTIDAGRIEVEVGARGAGARGVTGEGAGHELGLAVHAGGDAVHGANEGPATPADHAET